MCVHVQQNFFRRLKYGCSIEDGTNQGNIFFEITTKSCALNGINFKEKLILAEKLKDVGAITFLLTVERTIFCSIFFPFLAN